MAGVCPHFCCTYSCVERVKLIRPKDPVGQYAHMPKSQHGGWVGLLDMWQENVALCRVNKPGFAGLGGTAVQSRGGPGSLVFGGGFACLHGLWQDRGVCPSSPSLSSALHLLLPSSGSFQLSQKLADPSGCTSFPYPGPWWLWECPEPGEQEQLCTLWLVLSPVPLCLWGKCVLSHRFFFFEGCRQCNRTHTKRKRVIFCRTGYGCRDGEVPN